MKLLVFGGRDYRERHIAFGALDHLHARFGISHIVHGGASGADHEAEVWAVCRGKLPRSHIKVVNADWKDLSHPDAIIVQGPYGPYDKRAGMRRNQLMLDRYPPDYGLQFPGGSGTAGMRSLLDKAGIPVFQVYDQLHGEHEIEWMKATFARMGGRHQLRK